MPQIKGKLRDGVFVVRRGRCLVSKVIEVRNLSNDQAFEAGVFSSDGASLPSKF